jgi:osmotically-inducible protein OsmY
MLVDSTEDPDMRKAIVVLVGALCLVACSKDRPPAESATTTTRSGEGEAGNITVEEVRTTLLETKPGAAETINGLAIMNDNGVITLRGKVEDEATHNELVNRVRSMPKVKGVKDEIQVHPKSAHHSDTVGTTSTTGHETTHGQGQGTQGQMGQGQMGESGATGQTTMGQGGQGTPSTMGTTASKSDAVRHSMEKAHPTHESVIRALSISDDGTTVTIVGVVPDAATHQALLKAARETPGVKNVRDEMKVEKEKKKK